MIVTLWCTVGPAPQKPSAGCAEARPRRIEKLRLNANRQWKSGNYLAALKEYRKVIELDKSAYGPSGVHYEDLHNIAVLASDAGLPDEADKYYQSELQQLGKGGPPSEISRVYVDLGEQAQVEGRFSEAEADYQRALRVLASGTDPSDPYATIALDDLGWLYVTWGRLDDGARLLDQAQSRGEQNPRLSDPQWMKHLDTQAAYRVLQGKYTDAQRLWTRALKIGKEHFGPNAWQYDNLLVHFGQACMRSGDYDLARRLFEQYVTIESRASAQPREQNAIVLGELAHLYTIQHSYRAAEPLLKKSIAILQELTEKAPLSDSLLFVYYGDYYMAQNQWNNAAQQYHQALALQRQVLGDTRVAASSMELLSNALRKLHRKREAKQLSAEARKIWAEQPDLVAAQDTVDVQSLRAH